MEHEKVIKEKRTLEAIKKNLMGREGKLGCILYTLGQPIVSNTGGGLYDVNYFTEDQEDDFDIENARSSHDILTNLPVMGIEHVTDPSEEDSLWTEKQMANYYSHHDVGMLFDGLSRGMHLEIKYMFHTKELTVTYKGYEVYREAEGDLLGYHPIEEWEEWIETLYEVASKENKKNKEAEKEEMLKIAEQEKKSWIQRIRDRWGI